MALAGYVRARPAAHTCPWYVTWAEATAYARWSGRKLPTEAQFHRAAYGTPEGVDRAYPWGNEISNVRPRTSISQTGPGARRRTAGRRQRLWCS